MTPLLHRVLLLSFLLALCHCQCGPDCLDCETTMNVCILCKGTAETDVFGKCVPSSIDKCVTYGPNGECLRCQNTYTLRNNTCEKVYSGCVTQGSGSECFECGFGRVLTGTTCTGVINCATNQDKCETCAPGYTLQNNVCRDISIGCAEVRQVDGLCARCKEGYFYSGYKCFENRFKSDRCYVLDTPETCLICKSGFNQFNGKCLLVSEFSSEFSVAANFGTFAGNGFDSSQSFAGSGDQTTGFTSGGASSFSGAGTLGQSTTTTVTSANNLGSTTGSSSSQAQGQQTQGQTTTSFNPSAGGSSMTITPISIQTGPLLPISPSSSGSSSSGSFTPTPISIQSQTGSSTPIAPTTTTGVSGPSSGTPTSIPISLPNQPLPTPIFTNTGAVTNTVVNTGSGSTTTTNTNNIQSSISINSTIPPTTGGPLPTFTTGGPLPSTLPSTPILTPTPILITPAPSQTLTIAPGEIANCQVPNPQGLGCLICFYGYFPQNNQCALVSPLCDSHNVQTGQCFACKFGLTLNNGRCTDPFCASGQPGSCAVCRPGYRANSDGVCFEFDQFCLQSFSGRCQQCQTGYYIDIAGKCKQLPPNCNIANMQTGQCLQCAQGWNLPRPGSQCVRNLPPNCRTGTNTGACTACNTGFEVYQGQCIQTITIANCNVVDSVNRRCVTCQDRFYTLNSGCAPVARECAGFNANTGACTSCVSGLILQGNGSCQLPPPPPVQPTITLPVNNGGIMTTTTTATTGQTTGQTTTSTTAQTSSQTSDTNCRQFSNNRCIRCSNRYVVNNQGRCVPVNPLCRDFNPAGDCTSCYQGYTVSQGRCIIGQVTDSNCKNFTNGQCVECYPGFFVNPSDRVCRRLNPLCRTSNLTTGTCLSCYPGYSINPASSLCQISTRDPNCRQFRPDNSCTSCNTRFFVQNGRCTPVNPLCRQFNPATGACTSCYPGYSVSNSTCAVGNAGDVNCRTFNGTFCTACFNGFFAGSDGRCRQVNPLCRNYSMVTGACTACFQGYQISGQTCVVAVNRDRNCKNFDTNNQNACVECFPGYLSIAGRCTTQNPLCRTVNTTTGACLTCWQGYALSNGNCALEQQSNTPGAITTSLDPYCTRFNQNQCVQCSSGYYLNRNDGTCRQLDPLCRTSDLNNGSCQSCYPGYSLTLALKCELTPVPNIPNCNNISQSGTCLECLQGHYLSSNQCVPVSILCASYNRTTGRCLSCVQRHYLQNGQCFYPGIYDQNCAKYENAYCAQCRNGFYVSNYTCQRVDVNCVRFNYQANVCEECAGGRRSQGAGCV